jgi:2-methylcitrate dehydratase PrpD
MGLTKEIAEWVCDIKFSDLNSALVKKTKDLCLSGLSMTAAGVPMTQSQAIINYVKGCRHPEEAGVIGAGFRTSAEYAAMVNGTVSHVTELEDDTFPDSTYDVGIFPTSFALGEKYRLSGKDVMLGFAIGFEVASLLGIPTADGFRRGWCMASVVCSLGSAASAARLMGLNMPQTINALSIAASQAAGLVRQTGTGAHLFESGAACRNGITAAALAKQGMTGQPDIIEGERGLAFAVSGVADPKMKLGSFRIGVAGVKKYPCCFLQMHIIDAILDMIKKNNLTADDVKSVQVDHHSGFLGPVRYHHPTTEDDSRFSLPHSIAACFLDKKVFLDSYTNEKAVDPKWRAFRDKVKMVSHPEWDTTGISGGKIPLTITLKDGREFKKVAPGTDVPVVVTDAQLWDKYTSCMERIYPKKQIDEAAKMIFALDELKDISGLMKLITFPAK